MVALLKGQRQSTEAFHTLFHLTILLSVQNVERRIAPKRFGDKRSSSWINCTKSRDGTIVTSRQLYKQRTTLYAAPYWDTTGAI